MRVLIAFDGSAGAAEAVALAQTIAWPADSRLRIVSVVEPGAWIPPLPRVPMTAAPVLEPELVAYLETQQAEIVKRFALAGRAEAAVLRGRPASAIIDDARDFAADLVIVGSRGHGPIASLVLGSVSAEVVDHAPSPVLVARRETLSRVVSQPMTPRRHVRPKKSSPAGRSSMACRSTSSALRMPSVRGPAGSPRCSSDRRAMPTRRTCKPLSKRRSALRPRRRPAYTKRRGMRTPPPGRGDPAAEIIAFAEERQAGPDRPRIAWSQRPRRDFLGSVARNVLAGSNASVLVVREAVP